MATWKLAPGARMTWRDDKDVRHQRRGGDEVELTEEQEQRHRAGQPGSAFLPLDSKEAQDLETVEVAVANEATKPAEDGTAPVTPSGSRNRRALVTEMPVAQEESERTADQGREVPKPVTSTATRTGKK